MTAPTQKTKARKTAKVKRLQALDRALETALERKLRAARTDFNDFAEYVFEDTKKGKPLRQSQVHRDLQAAIDGNEWTFIELARDHGKTSQIIMRILWWLGQNPNELIKMACETDRQAKARILEVSQHILTNQRLRAVFPQLRPADVGGWTQHTLYIQRSVISRDGSLEAYGIGSGVIGGRATKLLLDDVTKPKSVRSEAARIEVKDSFYGVWIPMIEENDDVEIEPKAEAAGGELPEDLESLPAGPPPGERDVFDRRPRGGQILRFPDGRDITDDVIVDKVVWIGTPWHSDDLHCELLDKAAEGGWFVFSRPVGGEWARALAANLDEPEDDFSPVWPERWSRGRLLKRRRRMGLTHFARAYWLQPISPEDRVWDPADFRFIDWSQVPEDDEIIGVLGAWDFAFTLKTRNDRNAYVCLAVTTSGDVLVFRGEAFRARFKKIASRMVAYARRDGVDHLGYEKVQAQSWMGEYVADLATLPLRPLRPKGDKYSRAVVTQPYIEQGRVYFLPGTEELQAEMKLFPLAKHDDLVDAFVYALLMAVQYYLMAGDAEGDEDDWKDDEPGGYEDSGMRVSSLGGAGGRYNPSKSILDHVRWG